MISRVARAAALPIFSCVLTSTSLPLLLSLLEGLLERRRCLLRFSFFSFLLFFPFELRSLLRLSFERLLPITAGHLHLAGPR